MSRKWGVEAPEAYRGVGTRARPGHAVLVPQAVARGSLAFPCRGTHMEAMKACTAVATYALRTFAWRYLL